MDPVNPSQGAEGVEAGSLCDGCVDKHTDENPEWILVHVRHAKELGGEKSTDAERETCATGLSC